MELRIKTKPQILIGKTKQSLSLMIRSKFNTRVHTSNGVLLAPSRIDDSSLDTAVVFNIQKHRKYRGVGPTGSYPREGGHHGTVWIAHVYKIPLSYNLNLVQYDKRFTILP